MQALIDRLEAAQRMLAELRDKLEELHRERLLTAYAVAVSVCAAAVGMAVAIARAL